MNKEDLELMVKSLVPDDKKEGLHFQAWYVVNIPLFFNKFAVVSLI
jgi:hypothetical protein